MESAPRIYTISELTQEFGVSTRTLRFYEDRKLLKPMRRGRRRLFRPRDRTRLRLILRGKRLGLSLDAIGEILDLYDAHPGERAQILKLLERIGERRDALLAQRQDIEDALADLEAVASGAQARLAQLETSATKRES